MKLDILLNTEPVDALSTIVHRDKSYDMGKKLCSKLKELIPRHMFEVVIQAAIGNKVIARTTVSAMRKIVLAKCYGATLREKKAPRETKKGKNV